MAPRKQVEEDIKPSLDSAIARVRDDFGKHVLVNAAEYAKRPIIPFSTGILSVDLAMGGQGFLGGRIAEVYGPAKHGKTTLLLTTIAEAQKQKKKAAYVDAEHKLDLRWAEKLGVNLAGLEYVLPDYGEQALSITESLIDGGIDLIVVDSVAALVPRAELDGEMGEAHMGLQARMISQAMRKLNGLVSRRETALLFINQIRSKIGVVYGNPQTTSGGAGLEFYSSVRLEVRRKETIKEGDTVVGIVSNVKVVANQVGWAFEESAVDIYSGRCRCHAPGIDKAADLLDTGVAQGVIEKTGTWFNFASERIGQGRLNASQALGTNAPLFERVQKTIVEARKNGT